MATSCVAGMETGGAGASRVGLASPLSLSRVAHSHHAHGAQHQNTATGSAPNTANTTHFHD